MPRELRKIFFNAIDLTHAIESYRADKPQFLPQGKLYHVSVQPQHLLVRIELKYLDNTHLLDYQIDYDKLLDVLIAFCLEHRIPLPSAGIKRTYCEDEDLVLEVTLSDEAVAAGANKTEWTRLRGVNVAG